MSRRRYAADPARWVDGLSITVLTLALLYVVLGLPGDGPPPGATDTDYVNPLNSWIWLGLLALSLPVLAKRWHAVLALVQSCWPLLALYFYFALSATWALDPEAAVRRLILTLVQFAIIAILLTGVRRAPFVHVVIAGVCIFVATANLCYWLADPSAAIADDGFVGLQTQKNETGLLMMYGCLATVPCTFLVRGKLWRAVCLFGTALMAALLIVSRSTTSQSVVIAAAVVMPLLLLLARLPRRTIVAIAATTVLTPVAVLFLYLVWCAVTGADPAHPMHGMTFSARTDIWSFVVGQIQQRPLLGAGYSSFWNINPAVQPSLKTDQWFGVYSIISEGHDGYLDLLATGGIIGLCGGLFVLGHGIILALRAFTGTAPARHAWNDGRMARPTAVFHLAFLLGLIVHNFTESNLFSNNGPLAFALLLCLLDLTKWRLGLSPAGRTRR